MTWIAVAFLVGSLSATRVMCRNLLVNPLVCFFGMWTAAALLHGLNAVYGYFAFPVTTRATLLFALSFAAFFVGGLAGLAPLRERSRASFGMDDAQLNRLLVVTVVLLLIFITGVAWKLLFVSHIAGLPFEHLAKIRSAANSGQFTLPLLSRVMTLAGYVVVLNLAVLLVFRPSLGFGIAMIAVILVSFINDSTVGMRGSTVTSVLLFVTTAIAAVSVKSGRTDLKHLTGGVVVLLGGLLLVAVILYLRSNSPVSFMHRFLFDTYLTIAGQLPSTSYFIGHPWPAALPCQYTCSGVYQLIDLPLRGLFGRGILPSVGFSPSAPIIQSKNWAFNTAAYLAYFYADARGLGVGAFSVLMGYASARAFARAMTHPTPLSIQIAAMMMSLVIFSVRGMLTGVVFWGGIAFLIIQQRVVTSAARRRARMPSLERAAF